LTSTTQGRKIVEDRGLENKEGGVYLGVDLEMLLSIKRRGLLDRAWLVLTMENLTLYDYLLKSGTVYSFIPSSDGYFRDGFEFRFYCR